VGWQAEFVGDVGGQAAGDGAGDERAALLLEQFDQALLFRQQRVDV